MIALVPSDDDLDRLTVDGGEPRDELHLTLYYLGDAASIDAETRIAITTSVSDVLANREVGPLHATAFGVAHWNPTGAEPAWVLNVGDVPAGDRPLGGESLGAVRSTVNAALYEVGALDKLPPQHTPWQPHVCLIYTVDDVGAELESRLGPMTFDRVRVAFGGENTDVQLTQPATVLSASGGEQVPRHVVRDHSGCPEGKPWAVVKEADDSVAGCHPSRSKADGQLKALYANDKPKAEAAVTNVGEPCVDCSDDGHFIAATGSDAPWNGAASRFSDAEYQRSAAACDSGDGTVKERCFLPHHEPGGALNRNGLHAAVGRLNQLKGHDPQAVARAKSHLRSHYRQLGEEVPDVLKAEGGTIVVGVHGVEPTTSSSANVSVRYAKEDESGGPGDGRHDDCPPGQRKMPSGKCVPEGMEDAANPFAKRNGKCGPGYNLMPDGSCMSDAEMTSESHWSGVLVVEGTPTGDGREFSRGALTWVEGALLRWQKESSHGGDHDVTVSVGRIDHVSRNGDLIYGEGVLNLMEPDGWTIYNRLKNGFAGGISIDADDIQDADVEFVWGDDELSGDEEDGDVLKLLFGRPEKVIYHGGRVRAATLVDIPAFVEANIALVGDRGAVAEVVAPRDVPAAVEVHATDTSDEPWKMTVAKHMRVAPRDAYAWHVVDDGKPQGILLHHDVVDGEVGAANVDACVRGLASLANTRGTVPDEDVDAVYEHLAAHLRDAGLEPPPRAERGDDNLVAAAVAEVNDWRPPRAWFENPQLSVHTGITVTDQGRVYGHVAPWGECHIGFVEECVTTPHEEAHPYFLTGEVMCADGSRVGVGQITLGTGHAPLGYQASRAAEHYDNTGCAVADVVVGNDALGIWCAGAVRPYVEAARVHQLRASGRVSGDWRRIGGQLRLVGVLAVNVPGFPIPQVRARVASGVPQALVAAGTHLVLGRIETPATQSEGELDRAAMKRVMGILARRMHDDPANEGA